LNLGQVAPSVSIRRRAFGDWVPLGVTLTPELRFVVGRISGLTRAAPWTQLPATR
jgi:hypothetical protein